MLMAIYSIQNKKQRKVPLILMFLNKNFACETLKLNGRKINSDDKNYTLALRVPNFIAK